MRSVNQRGSNFGGRPNSADMYTAQRPPQHMSNGFGPHSGGRDSYGPPPGGRDGYGPPPVGRNGYGPPPPGGRDGYGPPSGGRDGYGPPSGGGRDGYGPPSGGRDDYGPPRDSYGQPPPRDDYRDREYSYNNNNTMQNGHRGDVSRVEFELDHLATFTVGHAHGLLNPEDGIRKLKQMGVSDGIWTMRCLMQMDQNSLIIIDQQTNDPIERFPLDMVQSPCAMSTPNNQRNMYNNVVLFTVDGDQNVNSEMHIFQCTSRPAQDVVDEINRAKNSHRRPQHDGYGDFNYTGGHEKSMQYNAMAAQSYNPGQRRPNEAFKQSMARFDDTDSVLSEHTNIDVQVLNQTFDDIERFVGRLQSSAEAFRELDRRRQSRKRSRHAQGDGMLTMRARPPPAKDFMDILQKFKLAFNSLAKLKPHIHDPNAPELVHFLFTPLSLIVEASKDPHNGTPDLATKVITPLLTADAKDLLRNCLTSKETDLWVSLGEAWTVSREDWRRGSVPTYYPSFYSGVNFPAYVFEDHGAKKVEPAPPPQQREYRQTQNGYDRHDDRTYDNRHAPRNPYPTHQPHQPTLEDRMGGLAVQDPPQHEGRVYEPQNRGYDPPIHHAPAPPPHQQSPRDGTDWKRILANSPNGACEATASRPSNNAKELTITMGECLEVLDKSKNWWKLKNARGEIGHAPYTILREISSRDLISNDGFGDTMNEGPNRRSTIPSPHQAYSPPHQPYTPPHPPPYNPPLPPPVVAPPPPPPIPDSNWQGLNRDNKVKDDNDALSSTSVDSNPRRSMTPTSSIPSSGPNYQEMLQDELRSRVAMGPQTLNRVKSRKVKPFTRTFTAQQIQDWMQEKGFSERSMAALQNADGEQLYKMPRYRIDSLLKDEAPRMASQIELAKNIHGYNSQNSNQLTQIMNVMKHKADNNEPYHQRQNSTTE